ncbi:ABC transporter permease [Spiractinospora alimapuensis]|uniref:ABC transporter permease n=1 Tax=Spiractinospora alimapuensis TaxID=2820884 RepID=UPI001F1BD98D|nr:ABC transporter permease [Spiractinospora alimapuensis]QVQ50158.1 ABC transporter permease [Spiractinospora alimapuensis]
MLVYTVRRVLVAIPLLFLASVLAFVLVDVSGDPLSDMRMEPDITEAAIEAEEGRLYLDRSMPERYITWVTGYDCNRDADGACDIGLLRGEFGPSVRGLGFDIGEQITTRLFTTLRLISAAVVVALGLAILAGVVSAVKQYSKIDYTLTFIGFLALAMPTFWLGALIRQSGVWVNEQAGTQLFATIHARSSDTRGFTGWEHFNDILAHLTLPTIALMLTGYAAWSRYQRTSMLEVLNSDYVRLARAKGLRNHVVIRRHALRTALIPLTTVAAISIAALLDGVVLIEVVFQWRGLGTFFVDSINERDSFALMAWLLLSGTIVIAANLIADLLYGVLDPRIRYD